MVLLALIFLLLVVAPASLLWLGYAIEAVTTGRRRRSASRIASASAAGDEWYRRKMLPAFTRTQEEGSEPHPAE